MKISLNKIRFLNQHYGSAGEPAPDGVDALVHKIGAQLGAVEEVTSYGKQLEEVVIAKVVSCHKHPNADKLTVCKIDDGGTVPTVPRDEQGHVELVCGAPNVREGLLVAWLPPGATVPSTAGKDPLVLEAREIRGVVSNGMLASAHELGISDDHSGILEIDADAAPGTAFVDAYNLVDEAVIDIENKMFTHRPDCFGLLGVAREIEGIHQRPYKSPAWYTSKPEFPSVEADELTLQVRNELPQLVPRFTAITMRDVTVKSSPIWLQILLTELGIRPINNIVDYTNFFMLETGQPLHAYDYDKVKAQDAGADYATLVVRHPKQDEKITLLGGKAVTPRTDAIMIATDTKAIGIGGVMGGAETEVGSDTKNIILECATFDMYSIRHTAMQHGLFTDAVTRFTKGQSPLQNLAVLAKIVDEIRQFAGGKVASTVIDDNHVAPEVLERGSIHPPITLTNEFVNARLGFKLSAEAMAQLLRNVEFEVHAQGDELVIKAPFWRTDIEIPEDVVEEIGRLYGYDHLPLELTKRTITPAARNTMLDLKADIRSALSRAGANEVLTYTFIHGNLLDKVGQDREKAFQLSNALSPDLQYYRLSLTPSLLDKVHANIRAGHDEFALFEIGKAHIKGELNEEHVPREFERVALVFAASPKGADGRPGAAYYQARRYLIALLETFGLAGEVGFEPVSPDDTDIATTYYAPGRTATVRIGDVTVGRIGEYKPSVRKALKLPDLTAGFELGLTPLLEKAAKNPYKPLSRFPKIEQDICLQVKTDVPYRALLDVVAASLQDNKPQDTSFALSPVDIYQKDHTTKRITLRLSIVSHVRTLKTEEVTKLLDQTAAAAADQLGAQRI